jgi:fucose permease
MANANEVLGLLHGVYGLGAVLAPLIATSMIARAQMPWFNFYYVMVSTRTYLLHCGSLAKND